MANPKQGIISFKVDETLLEALDGITNRSEFIRSAILAALENICPLCNGSGHLSPNQRKHWDAFSVNHVITRCDDCQEPSLICRESSEADAHHGVHA